jgi:hypothetical protein
MFTASDVALCNLSLAILKAAQIQSLNDGSLEAEQCNRHYGLVLAKALEGPHNWSFATRRVVLATTTNDRDSEWGFAYLVPADMASPIRLIPDWAALGTTVPLPLPGDPYAETWSRTSEELNLTYRIENGVIYTDYENATLEYSVKSIEEAVLPALFVDAMTTELASKLAVPVKGDKEMRLELMKEADLLWQRAIADDRNRQPETQPCYQSEAELARQGV